MLAVYGGTFIGGNLCFWERDLSPKLHPCAWLAEGILGPQKLQILQHVETGARTSDGFRKMFPNGFQIR